MIVAEFLVKQGLILILAVQILVITISVFVIKFAWKLSYFNYVTELLLDYFDCQEVEVVEYECDIKSSTHALNSSSPSDQPKDQTYENDVGNDVNDDDDDDDKKSDAPQRRIRASLQLSRKERTFVNTECYFIKVDPTSEFIHLPYLTRCLTQITFWGYFCIQILFLTEVDTTEHLPGYKCFNLSEPKAGKTMTCEKFGLISLEGVIEQMDNLAGILVLNEINRFVFKQSYRLFMRWLPWVARYFKCSRRLLQHQPGQRVLRMSFSQVNYLLILGLTGFNLYQSLSDEAAIVPIKLVCFFMFLYSTMLAAYATAKYSVAHKHRALSTTFPLFATPYAASSSRRSTPLGIYGVMEKEPETETSVQITRTI